jgi:hypothetical protein
LSWRQSAPCLKAGTKIQFWCGRQSPSLLQVPLSAAQWPAVATTLALSLSIAVPEQKYATPRSSKKTYPTARAPSFVTGPFPQARPVNGSASASPPARAASVSLGWYGRARALRSAVQ